MHYFLRFLILTILVLLPARLILVNGQQPNQQRPRRVTTNAGQSPNEAPPAKNLGSSKTEELDEGDVVRVETQLVSVPAVVTNGAGRPVAGLRTENFKLFENGQPQKITDFATTEAPFEIALLLDTSGSTRNDLELIREAAVSFVEALRPGDRVAIVGFNMRRQARSSGGGVEVLSRLTDNREHATHRDRKSRCEQWHSLLRCIRAHRR